MLYQIAIHIGAVQLVAVLKLSLQMRRPSPIYTKETPVTCAKNQGPFILRSSLKSLDCTLSRFLSPSYHIHLKTALLQTISAIHSPFCKPSVAIPSTVIAAMNRVHTADSVY